MQTVEKNWDHLGEWVIFLKIENNYELFFGMIPRFMTEKYRVPGGD